MKLYKSFSEWFQTSHKITESVGWNINLHLPSMYGPYFLLSRFTMRDILLTLHLPCCYFPKTPAFSHSAPNDIRVVSCSLHYTPAVRVNVCVR